MLDNYRFGKIHNIIGTNMSGCYIVAHDIRILYQVSDCNDYVYLNLNPWDMFLLVMKEVTFLAKSGRKIMLSFFFCSVMDDHL